MQADEKLFLLMKEALNHVNASAQTGHGQDGIAVAISFSALDHVKKALAAIGWNDHIAMERAAHGMSAETVTQPNNAGGGA